MSKINAKNKPMIVLLSALLLTVSFGAGYLTSRALAKTSVIPVDSTYDLLAKRIQIEKPSDILVDFRGLETELAAYVDENNLTDKVSVNFEYLPTGSSIGLSENQQYVGASLLKLPLAISAYKAAEEGKIDLDEKLPIKREWLNDSFGDLYKQGEGHRISNREAAKEALIYSDNTAAFMLFDTISKAQGKKSPVVLGFIDANYAETPSHDVKIDSRSYTSILKCLYFACHLNKDHSQELLGYMVKSAHTSRMKRDIPETVKVAHKIGVFNTDDTQSDCGIVYLPSRHYTICIMVKGSGKGADGIIADMSGIVYRYLASDSLID